MYLFNKDLKLTKYNTANDILLEFFDIRIIYYKKRKEYITNKIQDDLIIYKNKIRFIKEYIDKIININKKSKDEIIKLLKNSKYYELLENNNPFDYLLRMPIYNLTQEKIFDLNTLYNNKKKELDYIISTSEQELWIIDLKNLLKKLN